MLLGCIADDLTGATDLALMLTREGLRTVQCIGVPRAGLALGDVDAVVVAMKTRSIPAAQAVAASLEAARWLRQAGAQRLLFKYCSTFDSTDAGNIGPVAGALLAFAGGDVTIVCPAFPAAGRTIYAGQLFVDGAPLAESPMRDHPLNPMRDSDLRRVLARQAERGVGFVGFAEVDAGPQAIAAGLARERAAGRPLVVVDALTDRHLRDIGAAAGDLPLVTGGSGIAIGLPAAYLAQGLLARLTPVDPLMAAPPGRRAILAGSCSAMTRRQVDAAIGAGVANFKLDPTRIADGAQTADDVLAWADHQSRDAPILIYSSADPEAVGRAQTQLGRDAAGALVEATLAAVGKGLVARGVTRMIVAGGETSGAVVQALGVEALTIGPEIDPGVPWTRALGAADAELVLALKSGNFGAPDFFLKAWDRLA